MVLLSRGIQCTRGTLFALNILFLLLSFSVIGLGIYIKVNGNFVAISEIYSITEALGGEAMQWVGISMIIVGIFTTLLSGFGCLGAVLQKRYFLYTYAILLILIILLEFAGVIVTLVFRNDLWKTYDSGFMGIFDLAYSQNQTELIKAIENLEREFKCCGVHGPSDYSNSSYKIPLSCYPSQLSVKPPYTQGCAAAVTMWMWDALPIIAGILGGILFIEIFGVISSLVLGVAISHSSNAENYNPSRLN